MPTSTKRRIDPFKSKRRTRPCGSCGKSLSEDVGWIEAMGVRICMRCVKAAGEE